MTIHDLIVFCVGTLVGMAYVAVIDHAKINDLEIRLRKTVGK